MAAKSNPSGAEGVVELDGEGDADEDEDDEEDEEEPMREGELAERAASMGERKEGERNIGDAASCIVGPAVFVASGVLNDIMVFRTRSRLCSAGDGG